MERFFRLTRRGVAKLPCCNAGTRMPGWGHIKRPGIDRDHPLSERLTTPSNSGVVPDAVLGIVTEGGTRPLDNHTRHLVSRAGVSPKPAGPGVSVGPLAIRQQIRVLNSPNVVFLASQRREWDSNPRAFWAKAFQEPRIRPLCHPSGSQGIAAQAGRICDRNEATHASASRHAVSARARNAGPWAPAAG